MKYEANATTGKVIQREMTADEIAQDLADQATSQAAQQAQEAKAADKAALLELLGITEEQAKLLLS